MKRPNFFRVLDLMPPVEDPELLEERLREKQRQWARDRTEGNPVARRSAQRYLELLEEMRRVLLDPETCRREAETARQVMAAERQEQETKLAGQIEVIRASGTCDSERVNRLARRFEGIFSRQEIEEHLDKAGIQIDAPEPSGELLDPLTAREIREGLDQLGQRSLYTFLGKGSRAPRQELVDAAETCYRNALASGKTDLETTVRKDLAGRAKVVFADDASRSRYDRHLAVAPMEELEQEIGIAVKGGILSAPVLEHLIHRAGDKGVVAADARRYLEDWAQRNHVRVSGGEPGGSLVREGAVVPPPVTPPPIPRSDPAGRQTTDRGAVAASPPPLPETSEEPGKREKRSRLWAIGIPALVTTAAVGSWLIFNPPQTLIHLLPPPPVVDRQPPAPRVEPPDEEKRDLSTQPPPVEAPPVPGPTPSIVPPSTAQPSSPSASTPSTPALRKRRPSPREVPRLAVVVVGDEAAVTSAVREGLVTRLQQQGFQVTTDPWLDDLIRQLGDPLVTDLLSDLKHRDIDVLVHARLSHVGERELSYYGRYDLLTIARLELATYLVPEETGMGPGWSRQLEYTATSAARQAELSASAVSPDLEEAIRQGWRDYLTP